MTKSFARPLIAATLAFGIALSPISAAPAKAGSDETAAFIAALIGLAIVGSAINNNSGGYYGGREYYRGRGHYPDADPAPAPRRTWRKALPQNCLKSINTRQGRMRYFSNGCLVKTYRFANRLPQVCQTTAPVRNRNGVRVRAKFYSAPCLRNYGYYVARN